jgi:Holliday junction resolvase
VVGLGARAHPGKGGRALSPKFKQTNYARGSAFERRVRDKLAGDGYTVYRTAGSKTQVDLIAYKPGGPTLWIQCSLGAKSKREMRELVDLTEGFADSGPPSPVLVEKGMKFTFLRDAA